MLSVVKDNASQLLKQFGLEDDMDCSGVCLNGRCWCDTGKPLGGTRLAS